MLALGKPFDGGTQALHLELCLDVCSALSFWDACYFDLGPLEVIL